MAPTTWTFEISFLIFLAIIFFSQAISAKIRSIIPMPLIMGGIFITGFALGWLPTDMILSSNMIAVGTIAFNVLVIHSGTMISAGLIFSQKNNALLCFVSTMIMTILVIFGLSPFIGRDLALLAPGSIVGGGASCAIASRWVLDKNPGVSVFPWMIFMFQGLFSVPLVTWALKKEAGVLLADLRGGKLSPPPAGAGANAGGRPPMNAPTGLVAKIPDAYKTTAYYLLLIMAVGVLNKWLHMTLLVPFGINININVTALLFGFILGQTGLIDKAPLFKSDSYGLLLLGLMGLMANTLANNPLSNILRLLPPLLIAFVCSTVILVVCGIIGARIFKFSPYRGIALTMNCVMGFPVNGMLVANASKAGATEEEQGFLKAQLSPLLAMGTMLISNAVSIFLVSFLVNLV